MAGKCKWERKVINQMGSKGEEGNAAGRICCWVLRGRATEPGFGNGLLSARVWFVRMVSQEHSVKCSSSQWICVQMQSQAAEHRQDQLPVQGMLQPFIHRGTGDSH